VKKFLIKLHVMKNTVLYFRHLRPKVVRGGGSLWLTVVHMAVIRAWRIGGLRATKY
jgi:hypothetical protein